MSNPRSPGGRGPGRAPRVRLDEALVARGLAPTLERARAEVLAGNILIDDQPAGKASDPVGAAQVLRLRQAAQRFVSRGGLKLEAALVAFGVDAAGRVAVDLGASTGGFTDCLLQRGASRVYAIDVGYNQLAWKLRQDPRVVVMERTNARTLAGLPEPAALVVADVSFISLGAILPAVRRLLAPDGDAVLLVKPQFEVAADKLGPGGRLRDEPARADAIAGVLGLAEAAGFTVSGQMACPIPGAKAGNVEALVWLTVTGR